MKKTLALIALVVTGSVVAHAQMSPVYVERSILCESNNNRTATCPSGLSQVYDARLQDQQSHAPCNPGQSYQINRDASVTVSNGCRADFYFEGLTYQVLQGDTVLGNVETDDVLCESNGGRTSSCLVNFSRPLRIQVSQQHSHAACIPGQTYRLESNSIVVSGGCRADFLVTGVR